MLSALHWQNIHAYQEAEIASILADPDFAEALSKTNQYGRIGDWILRERPGRVLELGCGPGRFVALLARLGHTVLGVDLHSFPTWEQIASLPGVELQANTNAEKLPFPDQEFDYVVCMGALLYFADATAALSEMARVLKPGGRLIVRTVNQHNLYTAMTGKKLDPLSVNLYTPDSLAAAVRNAGFSVAGTFTYGFWPPCLTDYWWYLVNGHIPQFMQRSLSLLTPPKRRVNITVFASRNNISE